MADELELRNPRSRRGRRALWGAVLLLAVAAFAVRAQRAHFGLPYLHHWDEPEIANRALEILRSGDFNPRFFHYGSLPIYLNAAVDVLCYYHLVARPADDPEHLASPEDLEIGGPGGWMWQVSHPTFYLWNRRLTALFGAAGVLLAFLLGRDLAGWRAGLLAAGLLAGLRFHAEHSAYVTADVPASALALGCVWASLRFARRGRSGWLLAALALGGLAVSAKYNLAFCLLAPAGALAGAALASSKAAGSHPGYRPWLWAALVLVPPAAFLAGSPYALLDLPTFLDDTGYEVRHYLVDGHERFEVEPGLAHLASDLGRLGRNLGWPASALAVAGLVIACTRRAGLLVFALPLLQLWLTSRTGVDFHRNVLFVYPFAAVAAAVGGVGLYDHLAHRLAYRPGWYQRWRRAGLLLAVALLAVPMARTASWAQRTAAAVESRRLAVDELERRFAGAEPPPAVAIAEELRLHPLDLGRLELPHRQAPLVELACRPRDAELVLVARRYQADAPLPRPRAAAYDELMATGGEVLASFGRGRLALGRFSSDPEVELRRPWPRRSQLPALCGEVLGLDQLTLGEGARLAPDFLDLPPGSDARTPFFEVPAGSHTFSWRDAAVGDFERPPRLRAVALVRAGGEGRRLEALTLRPEPRAVEHRYVVELETPAAIALGLKHLADEPAGAAPEAEAAPAVRVVGLRLTAEPAAGSAP